MVWAIEEADGYRAKLKRYTKKHRTSTVQALENLNRYLKSLNLGTKPMQIRAGWIHPEPQFVFALDETGEKYNVHPIRLYVHPEIDTKTLWVITIGDKETQKRLDIPHCTEFVKQLKKARNQ